MGRRYDAIIFDLDDTLWDVEPVIVRAEHAMYEFLRRHYPRVPERHDLDSMRRQRVRMAREHPHMVHDFTWLRLQALRELAEEAGYPPSMAEEVFEEFYRVRNDVQLYADVVPALERLRRGYRLFALSNGNADLERIGLGEFFELHGTARAAGVLKPHPRAFAYVLDAAGIDASRVAHVGDDPEADVAGALGAGLSAVWVNRRSAPWPQAMPAPHHVVSSLGQLADWLAHSDN